MTELEKWTIAYTHTAERIIETMRIPWNSEADVLEIRNAIVEIALRDRRPLHHTWALDPDNVLLYDGERVRRVGPIPANMQTNPEDGLFWEGLILARQDEFINMIGGD